MNELRYNFYKCYNNVPMREKENIIAVIDGQPMSWFVCWIEIKNKTEWGKKILKHLNSLEII